MALLQLGQPPGLTPRRHTEYRPWLEHACFDRACAYCLEHARDVQIDHVIPESLDDSRRLDPSNLLPVCSTCNGPNGKWDYHPLRAERKRCPNETHAFLPLDPRSDDYAALYTVDPRGALQVQDGADYLRALWNCDVLFRLNRKNLKRWRAEALDLGQAAESLVHEVGRSGGATTPERHHQRDVVVNEVAKRLLFFEIFELPLSPELLALAQARREAERGPRPT